MAEKETEILNQEKETKKRTKKPAAKKTTAKDKSSSKAKSAKTGKIKNLLIVESPAKAKTIKKYLGSSFEVMSSKGHIRDLPTSRLGVDIEHDFTPEYIVSRKDGKQAILREIINTAKKSEHIYLATDPDREGEAIAWHLAHLLGLDENAPIRVTSVSYTHLDVYKRQASVGFGACVGFSVAFSVGFCTGFSDGFVIGVCAAAVVAGVFCSAVFSVCCVITGCGAAGTAWLEGDFSGLPEDGAVGCTATPEDRESFAVIPEVTGDFRISSGITAVSPVVSSSAISERSPVSVSSVSEKDVFSVVSFSSWLMSAFWLPHAVSQRVKAASRINVILCFMSMPPM